MNGIPTLVAHDLRLQYRYGIHAAYGTVIALYGAFLVFAGPHLPDWAVALVIFSDPSALGFFFLGGLMLLEKGEGVRAALSISPVSAHTYLLAKTITLTALALAAVIVLGVAKSGAVNWPQLLVAVVLTSLFYIGIGVPIALRFKTVNAYLLGSALFLGPVLVPAGLALVDPLPTPLLAFPPVAQFRLTLTALGYGSATRLDLVAMYASALLAATAALFYAHRVLQSELGRK
tara:strand:- start:11838 stop:12533 length:696 start_codon:yes stop_codon:yes gene_type:complete